MLAYAPAALFFLLFGIGVLRDRRQFSNAVLLGIAVSLLSLALLAELRKAPTLVAELAAWRSSCCPPSVRWRWSGSCSPTA